jgi:bifunctional DNA-binding transcriptional regulator/antitoxin component of YhaV-PrlF toxin-antitoxin module
MTGYTVAVDEAGRVVLPREVLEGLGLDGPGHLTLIVERGEMRAMTRTTAIRVAQDLVAQHVAAGGDAPSSEDVIAERRAAAAREARESRR